MSHEDDELNELLRPIRSLSPNDLQIREWQIAVQKEVRLGQTIVTTTRSKWAFQLVAAMLVGFVVGAMLVRSFIVTSEQNSMVAQTSFGNATYEHSHVNLD
jgi:tetrahydromethanopterin S-methyltransferase subunit E